jgi:putative multicomponent Na+:H+ antiporter subunit B
MTDPYIYVIVALLPITALMLLLQSNPYNALILRGILGAIAALIYAILGAADVALTEALMGTLLAISLYGIAVRSSMVVRVGIINIETQPDQDINKLIERLRTIFSKHYLRLELVPSEDPQTLHQALLDKEVHIIIYPDSIVTNDQEQFNHIVIRIQRLYDIMQTQLPSGTPLTYLNPLAVKEPHQ